MVAHENRKMNAVCGAPKCPGSFPPNRLHAHDGVKVHEQQPHGADVVDGLERRVERLQDGDHVRVVRDREHLEDAQRA
jgi:hypothetical protein